MHFLQLQKFNTQQNVSLLSSFMNQRSREKGRQFTRKVRIQFEPKKVGFLRTFCAARKVSNKSRLVGGRRTPKWNVKQGGFFPTKNIKFRAIGQTFSRWVWIWGFIWSCFVGFFLCGKCMYRMDRKNYNFLPLNLIFLEKTETLFKTQQLLHF